MKFHRYGNVAIDSDGVIFSGISWFPTPQEIFGTATPLTTTVLSNEEYRADKIAKRLWQVPDLSWVLDILNSFPTGVSEYTRGATVLYVPLARLRSMGLI